MTNGVISRNSAR